MEVFILYAFFTGCIFTSWLLETTDTFFDKITNILIGFINGWYATPILIGRTIKKIYKD